MLYSKLLKELKNKATSSFTNRKDDVVEIFRSIDKKITGQYFGDNREEDAEFELVIFGYKYGANQIYIRYPNSDFFVEMISGGMSSRGNMENFSCRNIHKEKLFPFVYEGVLKAETFKIMKHENHCVLTLGLSEFNFLERVANIDKYEKNNNFGLEYINEMLKRNFVPIPKERTIAYSFKTNDNQFIIIDQDAHNFDYESMRCFYGDFKNGIKLGEIKNFVRYRDGGTTLFDFYLNDVKHEFYSPSGFDENSVATWNKIEITEVDESTLDLIVDQLNIELADKVN